MSRLQFTIKSAGQEHRVSGTPTFMSYREICLSDFACLLTASVNAADTEKQEIHFLNLFYCLAHLLSFILNFSLLSLKEHDKNVEYPVTPLCVYRNQKSNNFQ